LAAFVFWGSYWFCLLGLLVFLIILDEGQEFLEGNLLVMVFVGLIVLRSFIGD
jgi:hypothetical protein